MKKVLIDISGRTNSGPVIGIELAKALAQNGYEVYAIVAKDALNLNDWLNEKSLKDVYILKTYTNIKNLIPLSLRFCLIEKKKVRERYRNIQFEYVFKPIFHIWAEDILAQVSSKKVITLCHDPIMHSGESWIKRILYKRHIQNSDDIVVLTKSFIPIVCKNYGFSENNVHFMPHGLMKLYKEKQNRIKTCMYKAENINYVFFGRIQKYKGVEVLYKAFKQLKQKYDNITLTIAGKGTLDNVKLVSDKKNNIRVENRYIPDEEVGCFFDGPNVVVILPYLDATQSGVIPIAMEYGDAIIASDTGGLREQLMDGKLGVFVEPGNVNDLFDKMRLFVENPEMLIQQRGIMQNAVKQLEWKEVVAKLLNEI